MYYLQMRMTEKIAYHWKSIYIHVCSTIIDQWFKKPWKIEKKKKNPEENWVLKILAGKELVEFLQIKYFYTEIIWQSSPQSSTIYQQNKEEEF